MRVFTRFFSVFGLSSLLLFSVFRLAYSQSLFWVIEPGPVANIHSYELHGDAAGFTSYFDVSRGNIVSMDFAIIPDLSDVPGPDELDIRFVEATVDRWEYICSDPAICEEGRSLRIGPLGGDVIVSQGDTVLFHDGSQSDRCADFDECIATGGDLRRYIKVLHRFFTYGPPRSSVYIDVSFVIDGVEPEDEDTELPGTHPGGGGGTCTFTNTVPFSDTAQLTETLGITSTLGITITPNPETGGITATIPYTRNINLMTNAGFESGGSRPDGWQKYKDATLLDGAWANLVNGVGWNDSRAVQSNGGAFDFLQDVSLQDVGATYAMGFHARCTDETPNCSESAAIYWGQMTLGGAVMAPIATGSPISTTYTQISGTKTFGGSLARITIKTTGNNIYIDDAFLYPTDEDGAPLCDPALYAPPGPGEGGGGGGDPGHPIVIPIPGGGGVPVPGGISIKCYECPVPTNVLSIGSWIGWLGCFLRNILTCQLRTWIYNMLNALMGLLGAFWVAVQWAYATAQGAVQWVASFWSQFVNFVREFWASGTAWVSSQTGRVLDWFIRQWGNGATWAYETFQNVVNWLLYIIRSFLEWAAGIVQGWWGWITAFISELWEAIKAFPARLLRAILESDFIQMIWAWFHMLQAVWDAVRVLVDAFIQMLIDLYHALARFLEMLIGMFGSLRDAFAADPYEIVIQTSAGEVSSIDAGALAAPGPNATKILWMFLAGLSAIDWFVGEFGLGMVLMMVVGSLAIGVILWTLRLWHDILPI